MSDSPEIKKSMMARLLVFFAPISYLLYYLAQGKLLLLGNTDHVDAQLPFIFAAKSALAYGQLPWWNPHIFNGSPLWGNPAIFLWYPFTWIELLAPRSLTLYVSTLISWVHYGGVFLAAFLYFRVLIGDEKWASFSTLVYGFSISVAYGLAVGNAYLPIYVFLPLSLYLLHSYRQRSFRKNIIFLTIALFLMFTGGFLQFLIYAMTILGSYVIFLAYHQSHSREEAVRLLAIFSVSLIATLLLSAPSWISILVVSRLVSRVSAANRVLESILTGGYITPIEYWLRLFMPNGYGFGMWIPAVTAVETIVAFCGVSSLFLAGLAIVCSPRKIVSFWVGFIILILLLVSSKLLVIQYFIFAGVEMMYGRLVFLLPLGIASLAGFGGKSLGETQVPRWKLLILNPFNVLLAIVLFSNRELLVRIDINARSMIQEFYVNKTTMLTGSNLPEIELLRAGIIIFVLVLTLAFINIQKNEVLWIIATSLLLLEVLPGTYLMHQVQVNPLMISASEPFFAFDQVNTPLPLSISDLEEFRVVVTEKIRSRKPNYAPAFAKESNQGSVYGYQSPWGYANGISTNFAILIQTVGALDLKSDCESGGLIDGNKDISYNATREVIFDPLCHPRLSDLMSVGSVLNAGRKWNIVEDRRDEALPRASLFYNFEVMEDSVAASNRLGTNDFDIHRVLVLEKEPHLAVGPADPKAQSVFVKNTPNQVNIWVHSNTPALLLLTDTYSPGWTAEIDGQPAEIIRTNVAFRSVWVPKGEHVVTFSYHPPLLIFSLVIGALGLLVFLGLAVNPNEILRSYFKEPL